MKFLITSLFLLLAIGSAVAQTYTISGRLLDSKDKSAILGANVLMVNIKDSTRSRYAISDASGKFKVKNLERAFYRLRVTSVGYKPYTQLLRVTINADIGTVGVEPDTLVLADVEIKGDVIPVETKGDTILYNADAFQTNPDASAADLVSKMPGIVVTETGVEANGESVKQVLMDGKRFFGQDPLLALNTIPSEVVNQVEVFDQASERSQFTGFDDGNTIKTMNVVTKEDKRNGQFGKLLAGVGTDGRFNLDGNINFFKNQRQLTILGMSNNINKRSFTDSDILGINSGGRRGFRRFFGGGTQLTPTGLIQTESYGLNYSNQWGDKLKIEGSYFYDRAVTDKETESSRESFFSQGTQLYEEEDISKVTNRNHRFNMRMEYTIDPANSLVFTPRITVQDGNSSSLTQGITSVEGTLINQTNNNYLTDSKGYNADLALLYRHKFEKRGRTFSAEIGSELSNYDRENNFEDLLIDSLFQYDQEDVSKTYKTNVTYTEPIGYSSQLMVSYDLSNQKSSAVTEAFSGNSSEVLLPEPTLSSEIDTEYTIHAPSVSFMNRNFGNFFNVSLTYQDARLNSDQVIPFENSVPKNFGNLLPSIAGKIDFGENTNMFIRYNTRTQAPSASQLQERLDNSDPLFYSIGNQQLDQSYTHQLLARIGRTDADKNTSFANFTFVSNTNDFITNATYSSRTDSLIQDDVVLPGGTQLTQPVNLDGYWNVRNNSSWGFLISKLKLNVNATVGLGYVRRPGLANNVSNISETYNANGRLTLTSNISENVDFNLSYQLAANKVENTVSTQSNTNYSTQDINGKVTLTFLKGTVFRSDLKYSIYNGVSDEFDADYLLWNVTVAKKFLKNQSGELALTVFDLLNQNQSFSQTVTSAYVEETQSLVLNQYFMMTFTYTLRNFKKNKN